MSWIQRTLGSGLDGILRGVSGLIENFKLPPAKEKEFLLGMEQLLQKRDSEIEGTIRKELEAKERLLVAELSQDDNFTKRARPAVVYFGLLVIAYNYCLIPSIQAWQGLDLSPFALPTEFWAAWSGIVMSWVLGRSAEKRGSRSPLVRAMTGTQKGGGRLVQD